MTNINHQAGNFLYEIAAWSDDVLAGKRDFTEMYDAIGSRLVPIADELIRQAPRPSSALPDVTDDEAEESRCYEINVDGGMVRLQGSGHPTPEGAEALSELFQAIKDRGLTFRPQSSRELFISPDADDEPTLWKVTGEQPIAILRRCDSPDAWPLVVAGLLTGCRHCGSVGLPGEDHSCPCPHTDDECTDHPQRSALPDVQPQPEGIDDVSPTA